MKVHKLEKSYQGAEIDGEFVLIHADSGKFFALKDTGLDVWHRLDDENDVDVVCKTLAQEYDAPETTIRPSVEAFVAHLVDLGLARYG